MYGLRAQNKAGSRPVNDTHLDKLIDFLSDFLRCKRHSLPHTKKRDDKHRIKRAVLVLVYNVQFTFVGILLASLAST